MKNLTFHIVGLTHNDVKGHEVEYAKEAEGRTICLVPDDANTFDMLAVKAYDKQQLIGYVSALEGEDVRALVLAVAANAPGAQVPLLAGDDEGAYVLASRAET